jgi:hypothetical protein
MPGPQIAEPLHQDVFAQHVGQSGDRLAVFERLLERFSEAGGDEQREIGVRRLVVGVGIAMAIHGHGISPALGADHSMRVHAEGPDLVLKMLRRVEQFRLIQLVGDRIGDHCCHLDAHADVDGIAHKPDAQAPSLFGKPSGSFATGGGNNHRALVDVASGCDDAGHPAWTRPIGGTPAAFGDAGLDLRHGRAGRDVDLVFELGPHRGKDQRGILRSQMADRRVDET